MAAKTWFVRNETVNGFAEMRDNGSPGADATSSPKTGWVVGTGSTNHSEFFTGANRASSTFTGTTVPDGSIDATNKDCWRSDAALSGDFASANWTIHFAAIGVTQAGAQDGRIRIRLLKADADGSNATEITGAQQQGGLITNLTSSNQQTSTVTFNPGAFSVSNQYIFVQLAWERTGAGGMTTTDVAMRIGDTASRVISSDFAPGAQSVTAGVATATATALGPSVTPGGVTVVAGVATAIATALAASVQATTTVVAGVATATATALDASASAGAGLVATADVAILTATALGPSAVPGGVTVTAGAATAIATALGPSVAVGGVSVIAGVASMLATALGAEVAVEAPAHSTALSERIAHRRMSRRR